MSEPAWPAMTGAEIVAQVQALVAEIAATPYSPSARVVHPTDLAGRHGLRRTRGGLWTVAGKRYRTKRLAIEAVTNWYATALTRASLARGMAP